MTNESVGVNLSRKPVPLELIQYVDAGVVEKLPSGVKIKGIRPIGASYFARTAKIEATDSEGEETNFFLKVHQFELGKNMMSSEYKSTKLLYNIIPEITVEPLGWGAYKETPDAYFVVSRYCELSGTIPDVTELAALVADFHRKTTSTNGEFGLPYIVYGGDHPLIFPVTKSWEETFSKGIEQCFKLEEETHGRNEEMHELREGITTLVIPRLLRPLESDGRMITPTLVHGDIWDGNASVDVKTGRPMLLDPAPLWAHNEYELGPWWAPRHKISDEFIAEYIKHYPVAQPVKDFQDRGALYNLKYDLHESSLFPGELKFRLAAMDIMRDLLKKFAL